MSTAIVTTLISIGQQALAAFSGGASGPKNYFLAFLDDFAVNSSALTDDHRAIMDGWIAGAGLSAFPIRPGASNQKIVMIAGMASQTGPEAHNQALSEQRALAVHAYLSAGLGETMVSSNVQALGASRPRHGFDSPGSEFAENRAVAVFLEVELPVIGATPPPPPPQDPPAPKSRQWALGVSGVVSAGDPIPILDALGMQYITGTLRNERTGEERGFRIVAGGLNLGISAAPIDIAVNLQGDQLTPFATHWAEFDDFDNTIVVLVGVNATDVYEFSAGSIGFLSLYTQVEPSGFVLKTNIGAAAQLQYGLFLLDND